MKILLIIYDNASYISDFPHALGYIAAVLRKEGHKVTIYNQDLHHYPEEHLTQYLDKNHFDIVGISVIAGYYQYQKLLKISKAINKSKWRPIYIIGGHGPSPEPEYFINKTNADIIIIGEGEKTILDLLKCNFKDEKIKGVAYKTIDNEIICNEKRPLIKDIDSIPFPAYDMFPMEYYRLKRYPCVKSNEFSLSMISGRGCPFHCTFCYRMDEGFRPRSPESIIDEMKLLRDKYLIKNIYFYDELLMTSPKRITELCEAFIKANLGMTWSCNGRLNFATPEVLNIMKKAGCVFINYGIEALDDYVLKMMKKNLTVDQIIKGIENTKKAGISPGLNIMWGNIGDTVKSLDKAVDFLLKYDDGTQLRTIRPVTPYPGSELYYTAIKMGKLKDVADFYENKHINSDLLSVNFTELSDEYFHENLFKANCKLIRNYYGVHMFNMLNSAQKLYCNKDITFRGFRQ